MIEISFSINSHPQTLLEGLQQNQTLDFQEQVRKAVVAAEDSGKILVITTECNNIIWWCNWW
jgi:hypothetical protein